MFENDDWDIDENYLKDFNGEDSSENSENLKNINDIKTSSISVTNITSNTDVNERGKNVVLNVFQLENFSVARPKNDNLIAKTAAVKSVLKNTESSEESDNKLKRKKNVAFSESLNSPNSKKKICISDPSDKPSTSFATKNNDDYNLIKSPVKKYVRTSRIKQTVVREFPGPAGLLPDDVNNSELIDLDALDENKNNKDKYAQVCSQNTKNLFTTGAWQLMMDDLPAGFEFYDIASIKQNALNYSRTFKKVPYLAGIIQKIDYKPNDPHIELKDLSGKIDARIHHSICKLYPNVFGTGIVILVKDVGLICTSKKYVCIIISPKSLVSIYSEEARLVDTPHLQKLLDNSRCKSQISQISILHENEDSNSNTSLKTSESEFNPQKVPAEPNLNIQVSADSNQRFSYKNLNAEEKLTESENIDNVHDFDFNEDDSWLGVRLEDFNSFKARQILSSTPMDRIENKVEEESIVTESNKKDKTMVSINSSYKPTDSNEPLENRKNTEKCREAFQCSENDTDDEILSQLDVDTIAASFKR